MLGVTTSPELDFGAVTVAPGDTATTSLIVRNESQIVEAYTFEVAGPCAPWTAVEPERLSLYPGTSASVTVRLSPPRSPAVRAGQVPLAVRVLPVERPEFATVPETMVTVEPFAQLDATLVPQRRRTWWRARFQVLLDNQGNTPVTVAVDATDAGEELHFRGVPSGQPLEPGQDSELGLRVRGSRLIWFGKSVTTPFRITATPTSTPPFEQESKELDGELVQLAILPRWLLAVLAALLALILLWLALGRPAVRSAARQAADDEVQQQVHSGQLAPGPSAPKPAGQHPPAANGQPQGSGQAGSGGGAGSGSGAGGGGTVGGQPAGSGQSSATIEVHANGGAHATGTYAVPAGQEFFVTDLVLANFQGDEGLLTVAFGKQTITTIALETFRNEDFHWVTPIEVPAGETVSADVTCAKPGTPATGKQARNCTELLNVSGDLRTQPR